jgi:hypothetical protein
MQLCLNNVKQLHNKGRRRKKKQTHTLSTYADGCSRMLFLCPSALKVLNQWLLPMALEDYYPSYFSPQSINVTLKRCLTSYLYSDSQNPICYLVGQETKLSHKKLNSDLDWLQLILRKYNLPFLEGATTDLVSTNMLEKQALTLNKHFPLVTSDNQMQ